MTKAQENLERPVDRITAAKKVAKLRGHRGDTGGWIRNEAGYPLCQGWNTYSRRLASASVIVEDPEQPGKWFVSVLHLSAAELRAAEEAA
jgi:hypothetical protein